MRRARHRVLPGRDEYEIGLRIDLQLQRVRGGLLHRQTKTEESAGQASPSNDGPVSIASSRSPASRTTPVHGPDDTVAYVVSPDQATAPRSGADRINTDVAPLLRSTASIRVVKTPAS